MRSVGGRHRVARRQRSSVSEASRRLWRDSQSHRRRRVPGGGEGLRAERCAVAFLGRGLYGWFDWDGRYPEITATTARKHDGIIAHGSQKVERVVRSGIPVTPPARTLIDLSGRLPYAGTRRGVSEALSRGQIQASDLVTSHHRGPAELRKILATAAPTRNEYDLGGDRHAPRRGDRSRARRTARTRT